MRSLWGLFVLGVSLSLGCSSDNSSPEPAPAPQHSSGDRAFLGVVPVLAVTDVDATLQYYEKILGFSHGWNWEDGGEYGGINRGNAWLHFNRHPEAAAHAKGQLVFFFVTGVDELYRQHKANGAKIVMEIGDMPWGFREYRVEDNNGYHLRIAEPIPCEDGARCLAPRRP